MVAAGLKLQINTAGEATAVVAAAEAARVAEAERLAAEAERAAEAEA